ncbi:MAG: toll/interleukin-1 receptor domain-containing protein, partial [Actinobacteria bacterium]|nr:toll/interleukin-1 receptor domain-containing protein [Actinomycetota bacterium]
MTAILRTGSRAGDDLPGRDAVDRHAFGSGLIFDHFHCLLSGLLALENDDRTAEAVFWSGVPFMEAIEKWIKKSDVVLCLIGEDWSTIADQAGNRRLDDPDDPVRAEVATALKRKGKRTIPVLIERSRMPTRSELPEDVRGLTELNGHLLS